MMIANCELYNICLSQYMLLEIGFANFELLEPRKRKKNLTMTTRNYNKNQSLTGAMHGKVKKTKSMYYICLINRYQ